MGLAGGDVAEGRAGVLAVDVDAAEEVAGLLLQAGGVNHRAGGHHPDDIPLHQPLGRCRVLHLLTDGHLVALGDEAGNVCLGGVVGHPAHGGALLGGLVPVPGGEGQVQLPGGQLRVVSEHLIEVAQPEEQDGVRIVLLDLQVLLHHGGEFGQKGHLILFLSKDLDSFYGGASHGTREISHVDGWAGQAAERRPQGSGSRRGHCPCGIRPPFSF